MAPNHDLRQVLSQEHEGMWVALTDDRSSVIDSSDSLLELRRKVGQTNDAVVYMKVLPFGKEFAFSTTRRSHMDGKQYPYPVPGHTIDRLLPRPLIKTIVKKNGEKFAIYQ